MNLSSSEGYNDFNDEKYQNNLEFPETENLSEAGTDFQGSIEYEGVEEAIDKL